MNFLSLDERQYTRFLHVRDHFSYIEDRLGAPLGISRNVRKYSGDPLNEGSMMVTMVL